MSKIDYSKWDKIDCSSSEDEEESSTPHVTRLDAPSRITRTTDGNLVVEEQPSPDTRTSKLAPKNATKTKTKPKIENWTENGSQVTTQDGLMLCWSQDRDSVCLRLALPKGEPPITAKNIQVKLTGVRPFTERCSAVGNDSKASLRLTCNTKVLLEGEFPHPIHATEDSDDADWELDRMEDGSSYWVLTVQKATPMPGMTIWWRRPLLQFPEIEARQANPNTNAEAFQNAWEEAHRQFREKAKSKQHQRHATST